MRPEPGPPQRLEHFTHSGFSANILLPHSSEALIDETEFDGDERLPYWAELWPSARALTRYLLEQRVLPERALELGCGVGLPSLALLHRGVQVLATDYYQAALDYAIRNAQDNQLPELRTHLLDWREEEPTIGRFPLILAADVLYESRNVEALLQLLPKVIAERGTMILADPGRNYLDSFLDEIEGIGWRHAPLGEWLEASPVGDHIEVAVQLFQLFP